MDISGAIIQTIPTAVDDTVELVNIHTERGECETV